MTDFSHPSTSPRIPERKNTLNQTSEQAVDTHEEFIKFFSQLTTANSLSKYFVLQDLEELQDQLATYLVPIRGVVYSDAKTESRQLLKPRSKVSVEEKINDILSQLKKIESEFEELVDKHFKKISDFYRTLISDNATRRELQLMYQKIADVQKQRIQLPSSDDLPMILRRLRNLKCEQNESSNTFVGRTIELCKDISATQNQIKFVVNRFIWGINGSSVSPDDLTKMTSFCHGLEKLNEEETNSESQDLKNLEIFLKGVECEIHERANQFKKLFIAVDRFYNDKNKLGMNLEQLAKSYMSLLNPNTNSVSGVSKS